MRGYYIGPGADVIDSSHLGLRYLAYIGKLPVFEEHQIV